jgi:hypothetical protein
MPSPQLRSMCGCEEPLLHNSRYFRAELDTPRGLAIRRSDPTIHRQNEAVNVVGRTEIIREFNEHVMKLSIMFEQSTIIEADGVAIHYSRWSRENTSNGMITVSTGVTTDVLRRQQDGSWLLCLDNPWGIEVLPDAQRIRY